MSDLGRLVVLAGPQTGRRFQVGATTTIGRSPEAHVVLDDAEISRTHARIVRVATGSFEIEDNRSRNGTFVNGVQVEGRSPLTVGDKVRLGQAVILLFTAHNPLEEQLIQRQRLEALGRMTAGVAHDFNNMLGVVLANLDYMAELSPSARASSQATESLTDIRHATRRAAELASRLLSFSRAGSSEHEVLDLSVVCAEIVHLLRRTLPSSVRIDEVVEPALLVDGDAAELHQLIMNLCLNARDALPAGGTLTIRAKRIDTGAPELRGRKGHHALVAIADDGVGMTEEVRKRVFEPFFTTKRELGGVGLGLATSREIATIHGGELQLHSKPGDGTVVRLVLPARSELRKPAITTKARPGVRLGDKSGGELVLLVEDESMVRRSMRRVLERVGYKVVEAGDGEAALAQYGTAKPKPEVVILDLGLPGLSGEETLRRLLRINPHARVVCVSGDEDPRRSEGVLSGGAFSFLRKPVGIEALRATIDEALHGDDTPQETSPHLLPDNIRRGRKDR